MTIATSTMSKASKVVAPLKAGICLAGLVSFATITFASSLPVANLSVQQEIGIDPIITGPVSSSTGQRIFIEKDDCLICGDADLMRKIESARATIIPVK